jgi:hypothetical protein
VLDSWRYDHIRAMYSSWNNIEIVWWFNSSWNIEHIIRLFFIVNNQLELKYRAYYSTFFHSK